MVKASLKFAWRSLARSRLYTVINILGLSIGISACLIIFLICKFELSYDKFHPDKDRIYRMVSRYREPGDIDPFYPNNISHAAAHILRDEYPGVDQLVNFYTYQVHVTVPGVDKQGNHLRKIIGQYNSSQMIIVEPQYFSIFRYEWLAGSPLTSLNRPFQVVLTESQARKYFGSMPLNQLMGKELVYDDSLHLRVSGIVKDWTEHTDLDFKDFISYSTIGVSFLKHTPGFDDPAKPDSWGERTYAQTYVRLKKGFSRESAEAWIAAMVKSRRPFRNKNEQFGISLQPLSALHFDSKYFYDHYSRQAHLPTLYALMGISAFILIIAIINFINLSTAQSIRKAREVGIRKVLGSRRTGIILQFLYETVIVVLSSMVVSLLITRPVLHGFSSFVPPGLGPGAIFTFPTLTFLVLVGGISILLAGLYPAIALSSFSPVISLKGQTMGFSRPKPYFRQLLIIFQFGISFFFIVATMVIGDQIHFMLNKDLGFKKDLIVNIDVGDINPNLHYTLDDVRLFGDKVRQLSGVSLVSVNDRPVALSWDPTIWLINLENGDKFAASCRFGDQHYVSLFGLKIVAGRNLQMTKTDSISEFLINEACAKQFGFQTPGKAIGHMISCIHTKGPIVGVLADFNSQSLDKPVTPLFIAGYRKFVETVSVKLASARNRFGQFNGALAQINKIWKKIYPTEDFNYSFFDEDIARFYEEERKNATIMNAAMAIAVFISCMGLFGLATFTAEQKIKEIGIRKVLGASVAGLVAMMTGKFLRLVAIAILFTTPVAWFFMQRWLQDFAFRININWWIFALAALAALFIAFLTVSYQAIRAAKADPVKSMRTE